MLALERIIDNWAIEPTISTWKLDLEFEDDGHIMPFNNIKCPLTKEVMKDPIYLELSQMFEQTAIEYCFKRCFEDGRDPTCLVIEEWVNWNNQIQVQVIVQHLSKEALSTECKEIVLDSVYRISDEHPFSR